MSNILWDIKNSSEPSSNMDGKDFKEYFLDINRKDLEHISMQMATKRENRWLYYQKK